MINMKLRVVAVYTNKRTGTKYRLWSDGICTFEWAPGVFRELKRDRRWL